MTITALRGYTGTSLMGRISAHRDTSDRLRALAREADEAGNAPSTRVTLSDGEPNEAAVYFDPRASNGFGRLWSAPVNPDDAVSALMARNRNQSAYNLGDQWRGLGGAALKRFGETGASYSQALVDGDPGNDHELDGPALPDDTQTIMKDQRLTQQAAALAHLSNPDNPTATLKVQTRSGQTVELAIVVGQGSVGGLGLKVDLTPSGRLSEEERAAVAGLADGLDRALEGLGQDPALQLDLSGLVNYDHSALASVNLRVDTQNKYGMLDTFSMQLDDRQQSLSVKGSDGELNLKVDTRTLLLNAPAQQRDAALLQALARINAAGDRSHARPALVAQMKAAFTAFQATATRQDDTEADPTTLPAPVQAAVASQLSGLADFNADFGGNTWRSNRNGTSHEGGTAGYHLGQTTRQEDSPDGGSSVAQTVSEELTANLYRAPNPGDMIDTSTGHYTQTQVHDRSTVTTRIDATADGITRALRKTDEHKQKHETDYENHVAVRRHAEPQQRSFVERLPAKVRPSAEAVVMA
jgi:hypothetical protein